MRMLQQATCELCAKRAEMSQLRLGTQQAELARPALLHRQGRRGFCSIQAEQAGFGTASLPSMLCCSAGLGAVRTFIFERRDDFPEILDFVRAMDARYGLRLEELEGDFRSGLASLIRRSGVKAIVLGTRRRDPSPLCKEYKHAWRRPVPACADGPKWGGTCSAPAYGGPQCRQVTVCHWRRGDPNAEGQNAFCPCSAGWPPFMQRAKSCVSLAQGDPDAEGQDAFCPSSAGWPLFMQRARSYVSLAQGEPQRGGPGRVLPQQRGLAALHAEGRIICLTGAGGTLTRGARTRSAPAARAGRPSC